MKLLTREEFDLAKKEALVEINERYKEFEECKSLPEFFMVHAIHKQILSVSYDQFKDMTENL